MERKKRSHLQQFGQFRFQKPKNPLTKRRVPLSERRVPLSIKRKTDAKHGTRVHICTLDREICQVRKDGELGCQIAGEGFSSFLLKNIDEKSFAELLMMLLETEGTFPACLSNCLAKFVSQILFANSQNNIRRKKKVPSPTIWQIMFSKTQEPR